ncbi:MAG: hypothetical protein QMD21_07290 [Candidatus Thermoplasmatota archaeon]|nr:hypothetical protein [Candidatus Thermoplasmatota archaeon]
MYTESGKERVLKGETIDRDDGFIEVKVGDRNFIVNKNAVLVIKDPVNKEEPILTTDSKMRLIKKRTAE